MPIYLQIAQGATPTVSGLLLIPMTIGILVTSTLAGRYMGKTGRYRILPILGTGFLIIGMLLLSRLQPDTTTLVFSLSLGTVGLGMGCIFPVVTTAVQNAVPREVLGTATAAGLMFRQIGGSLAVAAFGAIFAARMSDALAGAPGGIAQSGEIGPQMLAQLPPEAKAMVADVVVNALHPIYLLAAGIAVVGLIFSFVLEEVELVNRRVPQGE
jgi:MFS family permease